MNGPTTSISSREPNTGLAAIGVVFQSHGRLIAGSLFAVGFTLYFALNIGLVVLRIQARATPIHVDDSYVYIIKAVQMGTCFWQDCTALEDLRTHLTIPASDREMTWVRYKEYTRAFLVYHPLHSALVVLLRATGLSWEAAYEGIRLAGSAFISIAMAYWLITLLGPGPAGIALGLLSVTFFYDQGLHYVVPSNLALGIAMLVWARISASKGSAEWSLALGTLALAAMHPIGRLYGIASIILFLLFASGRPWTKSRLAGLSFSIFIVGLSFLLPVVVSRPELNVRPDPPLAGWPTAWYGVLVYGVLNNFRTTDEVVRNWIALYGSLASFALITALGYIGLKRNERSTVVKNGLVLAGLLIVSVAYVLPRYPGELFHRVWIPMAILLTGATGAVAWALFVGTADYFFRGRDASCWITRLGFELPAHRVAPNWIFTIVIVVGMFLAVRFGTAVVQGLRHVTRTEVQHVQKDLWTLDPVQPKLMLAQARPSDSVLYFDEVPMHFYFTHGSLQTGAIFYPAMIDPSMVGAFDPTRGSDSILIHRPATVDALVEKDWLYSQTPRFLVNWSPVTYLKIARDAMIPVAAFNSIEYSSPVRTTLKDLKIYLVNPGKETNLHITYAAANVRRTVVTPVPRNWSGWLAVPEQVPDSAVNTFSLKIDRTGSDVYLKGIRVDNSDLNWPWNQRASVIFRGNDTTTSHTVHFDPDKLFPIKGLDVSVKILNDNGSTVLGELVRFPLITDRLSGDEQPFSSLHNGRGR